MSSTTFTVCSLDYIFSQFKFECADTRIVLCVRWYRVSPVGHSH